MLNGVRNKCVDNITFMECNGGMRNATNKMGIKRVIGTKKTKVFSTEIRVSQAKV